MFMQQKSTIMLQRCDSVDLRFVDAFRKRAKKERRND